MRGAVFLICIFLSSFTCLYSQTDTSSHDSFSNLIKITPLKLLGTDNPGVELAYEKVLNENFSLQLMASYLYITVGSSTNKAMKTNDFNYRFSVEPKFYIDGIAPNGMYFSFETNYMNKKVRKILDFKDYTPEGSYEDTVLVFKQTLTFNMKLGHQFSRNRLTMEIYMGLGLRYKDVRHLEKIDPDSELDDDFWIVNITGITYGEGNKWTAVVPLNMKIGYIF